MNFGVLIDPEGPAPKSDGALEHWDYEDPCDAGCWRPCTPDGCHDDHPSGTFEVIGPSWSKDDLMPRLNDERHAQLMAAAPALALFAKAVPPAARDELLGALPEWAAKDVLALLSALAKGGQ